MSKVEIFTIKQDVFLYIDDYLWMWDTLEEQREQSQIARQAHGDVLVAGYGLGILQQFLIANPAVTGVYTFEICLDVMEAAKAHYGKIHGHVSIRDFYVPPENPTMKYDCVVGDIWQDITPRCLPDYKRFKEVALQWLKPGGKILAWGKETFEVFLEREACGTLHTG